MIARLRRAEPLGLLAALASLALTAYALSKLLDGPAPMNVLAWLLGAVVLHDLLAYPLYTGLDRLALGAARTKRLAGARNYLRVPAALSLLALLVYAPNILDLSGGRSERATGLSPDAYLSRWLLICGGLFAASGLLYALRLRRSRRPHSPGPRP